MMSYTVQQHQRQRYSRSNLLLCFSLLLISFFLLVKIPQVQAKKRRHGNPLSRSIRVVNLSGVRIDLFWIHPHTKELADSNTDGEGIVNGGETSISSYVSHDFEVQEIPNKRTKKCKVPNNCQKTTFKVGSNDDQTFTVHGNFTVTMEDSRMRATQRAKEALQDCTIDTSLSTPELQLNALTKCLEERIELELNKTNEEITFQATVRKDIASRLKRYACEDNTNPDIEKTTSTSIHNSTWNGIQVQTLFETEYSSIQLYKNFLNTKQCQKLIYLSKDNDIVTKGIPLKVRKKDSAIQKIMNQIQNLVSTTLTVRDDYYETKDPMIQMHIDSNDNDQQQEKECIVDDTGDTTCATNNNKDPILVISDDNIIARLIVLCTDEEVDGGTIFFPLSGIEILPENGDAILIQYQTITGQKDNTVSYLNEHIICPVQKGTIVDLEDIYKGP